MSSPEISNVNYRIYKIYYSLEGQIEINCHLPPDLFTIFFGDILFEERKGPSLPTVL